MQGVLRSLRVTTNQNPVILYTFVGKDNFHVLLITPGAGVKNFSSPIKATDLKQKLLRFRAVLQSPAQDPQPLGRELYDLIFRPIAAELNKTGARTLMWSLDDMLRYVPMAALWDGERYLVESYQNIYFTRTDGVRMTRDVSRKWTGVAFGNAQSQVVDVAGSKVVFSGLPGVAKEMSEIYKRPPGGTAIFRGETFIDKRFTKDSFYRALRSNPSVVHISSHFSFRPDDDAGSFLLLGDGTKLTLEEMANQKGLFNGVELLVLSACETAMAPPGATQREVDGFAELAQRLGADAVVSTLWQVSDDASSRLIQEFYEVLKSESGTTKAEALRRAQLALLNGAKDGPPFKHVAGKPFAHPYYWAPFILTGNWK